MKLGNLKLIATLLFVFLFSSCQKEKLSLAEYFKDEEKGVKTGGVKLIAIETPIGKFKVWTKKFGNNPRIKLLLLHGGPGSTHEYFECFESYLPKEGIEFIYYDQLGSAYSDQPKDSSLWTVERFIEEVEQVRKALGLNKENFFLLGHSWGGILAMEYALKYQENLKGLIISNMMSSCPKYGQYADEVLSKDIPPDVLKQIKEFERKGDYQNPKYMELLLNHYYVKHVLRMPLEQWPDPVNRAFKNLNYEIYLIMQGPSEFGIAGRLAKWDRSNDIKKITVPTLVIGAKYDTMDPEHMEWMSKQLPNGGYLFCPNGSHMAMYDDQETYMNGLIKFLKEVDAGKTKIKF